MRVCLDVSRDPDPERLGAWQHAVFDKAASYTLWYYRETANAFQNLLPGQLADELMDIVIVLENE